MTERMTQMTKKTKNIIRTAYKTLLSVMLAVSGILLIYFCVSIYNLGDRPFTQENIAEAFSKIAIPIYATVIAVVIGAVASLFTARKSEAQKSVANKKKTAERLEKRLDISKCPDETVRDLKEAKKRIMVTRVIFISLSVAAFIPALIYVFLPSSYTMEYNGSVIRACLYILPCALVSALSQITLSYLDNANYNKLISQIKLAISSGAKKETTVNETEKNSQVAQKTVLAFRIAVLAVSAVFIIEGITNGGFSDVLIKAINICTECIGLG